MMLFRCLNCSTQNTVILAALSAMVTVSRIGSAWWGDTSQLCTGNGIRGLVPDQVDIVISRPVLMHSHQLD